NGSERVLYRTVNGARFFFFFSSRRRHTRWPRDWSSDVCSSDLRIGKGQEKDPMLASCRSLALRFTTQSPMARANKLLDQILRGRSEERRVGKECRSRWWPDP